MSRSAGTPTGDGNARPARGPRTASAVAAPAVSSPPAGQSSAPGVIAPGGPTPDGPTRKGAAQGAADESGPGTRPRPSPLPRDLATGSSPTATNGHTSSILPMDDVGIGARVRRFLLAPPALLTMVMTLLAVLVNRRRLGLDLAGGRLLPVESLGQTWSSYLASWHPVGGGSAAPPPAALAVIGILGLPVGSPAAAVSILLLAAIPLAGLSAYWATRAVPVSRKRRALAAAGYALLPPAIAGLAQGRLDVVLTYLLLPLVLAGAVTVLRGGTGRRSGGWLPTAAATALGIAVIGAFAPLLHLLVLAMMLIGFVVFAAPRVST
ncbi:MAG: glycosyltransferase, partial [Actinomycetota bacterium]|nr:glycosyltransferase [Actinomycetota bacterium]